MSEESARLRIPYLAASQAQKHVTHNEALTLLDTLCQASVIDKDLTTPPISPAEGDCYIVAATGTGAWTGWDNRIVRYIDGEWRSYLPGAGSGDGWLVYVQDEANLYVFNGSAWTLAAQPLDSDLIAIAGLSPSNDDVIQSKAGAWTNRTPAQLKTDLALTKGDVGLSNVDNTSDANKPVSTAQQAAIDLKQPFMYCRVAVLTADINIATALVAGQVHDGVTLLNGDPVLVWNQQTNPEQNGVWICFSTPFRSAAFPAYTHYAGALFSVTHGNRYARSLWHCINSIGGVLGTSPLNIERVCRELLNANRTYYVRTDGNDSNDGLSNTSGGAFLTVQKAMDATLGLDLGGFDVTIQVADGTYTGTIRMETPQVGDGDITIQGNNGAPGNVILTATNPAANEGTITARNKARLFVKDLEIRATTTGGCITADKGASIYYQNVNFGSCALQQVRAQDLGSIEALGNYAITGGGQAHWVIAGGGTIRCQSKTITLTGTPGFAAFAIANGGTLLVGGNTYSGSATGQRFQAFANGTIIADASATTLPGNAAGTLATGGRYTSFNGPEDAAAWGIATVSAGVPTLAASFNITSITDTATGELTVTIATDFASANYAWLASVELPGTTYEEANVRNVAIRNGSRAAGSVVLDCYDDTEDTHLLADPASWHFAGFGAQY
jgi:hypothetical protein